MKIVIASDPFGVELKETVKAHLVELGHTVADVGAQDSDSEVY